MDKFSRYSIVGAVIFAAIFVAGLVTNSGSNLNTSPTTNIPSFETDTATDSAIQVVMPNQAATSSAAPALQKESDILCNGKKWSSCSSDNKFYCSPENGGECVPKDDTLCNGKWWMPCPSKQNFYCPSTGDAQCVFNKTEVAVIPRVITAKANVGLLCYFKTSDLSVAAAYSDSDGYIIKKASGVIINPEGYILTARHLVDPQWTNWAYASSTSDYEKIINNSLKLDYCEVGVPQTDYLPSKELIQKTNPNIVVLHPFPYIAEIFFVPQKKDMSDYEYRNLDFAILKISAPMKDCETFNLCNLPATYPYNPVIYESSPSKNDELINFGYPAEGNNSQGSNFNDFFLKGTVGYLVDYFGGDQYFKNLPLYFNWFAEDLLPGKSGSPVYWNGYVAGVFMSHGDMSKNYYTVGTPSIYKVMNDNGLSSILFTK